jgi:hypothetical protein
MTKKLEVGSYERTITKRPVTFVCKDCSQECTELHYPGPDPQICERCKPSWTQYQNRLRKRRQRERAKEK